MYLECTSSVGYFPKRQDEGEVMQTCNALYFCLGRSFSLRKRETFSRQRE